MSKLTPAGRLAIAVRVKLAQRHADRAQARVDERQRRLLDDEMAAGRAWNALAAATEALVDAWERDGRSVPEQIEPAELLDWLGIDVATYRRAVEDATEVP